MTSPCPALEMSADVEDVSSPAPSWGPTWLKAPAAPPAIRGGEPAGGGEGAVPGLPGRTDQRNAMAGWSRPARDRWADLAELGEAEGLEAREAEALAFLATRNEMEADRASGVRPEATAAPIRDLAGWSPTLNPIDPGLCAGKTRVHRDRKPPRRVGPLLEESA